MWAFSTYLPLNLILTARNPSKKGIKNAVTSAARSSAFLGTFIALYYYGICLARTRIGPRILGTSVPVRNQIDSGMCVGCGCALCGWSVLIENEGRRKELGLFVAPRSLATLLPRRYLMEDQWKETLAFAMIAEESVGLIDKHGRTLWSGIGDWVKTEACIVTWIRVYCTIL
jgi:hypothetical protein